MVDYKSLERRLVEQLRLNRRPVAVAFLDQEPTTIPKFIGSEPSGCSFWRIASDGKIFYTIPADHYNCAIGSYTHKIPMPPERARELDETLGLMFDIGYVRSEEIPGIPQLPATPRAIMYSPLGETPVDPSVVLFVCQPSTAMLLNEAAMRAGTGSSTPMLGRPTCMALPAALAAGTITSLGCIGNRVYTDLQDDELYMVVPGVDLNQVAEALGVIISANSKLTDYARQRRLELSVL